MKDRTIMGLKEADELFVVYDNIGLFLLLIVNKG